MACTEPRAATTIRTSGLSIASLALLNGESRQSAAGQRQQDLRGPQRRIFIGPRHRLMTFSAKLHWQRYFLAHRLSERFLAPGKSRRRPLKGRGERAIRTIPLPPELVPVIERHLAQYVPARADAYAFTTPTGRRLNMSNFQRSVWAPAREAVFAENPGMIVG